MITESKLNTFKVQPVYQQLYNNFSFDETLSATFYGRRLSPTRLFFFYLSSFLTLGLVYLIGRWSAKFNCWARTYICPIALATHILVINSFNQWDIVEVIYIEHHDSILNLFARAHDPDTSAGPKDQSLSSDLDEITSQTSIYTSSSLVTISSKYIQTVDYRCNRFIVNPLNGRLSSSSDFHLIPLGSIEEIKQNPRSEGFLKTQRLLFGFNLISVQAKGALDLFLDDVLHPFNVFQVGCMTLWVIQDYKEYAAILFIITAISCIVTLINTKKAIRKMQEMAIFVCPITLWKNGEWVEGVSSDQLVPGDLVRLDPSLGILPCDGVLLNGDAILDESMLTGETVPVSKIALEDEGEEVFKILCSGGSFSNGISSDTKLGESKQSQNSFQLIARSILFSGTHLIRARAQNNNPAYMMVHKTGFLTTKGNLVQSIMFPRPNNFKFNQDLISFIWMLTSIAFVDFWISLMFMIRLNSPTFYIVTRCIDLFTIVVPPAIHTVMATGTIYAIKRLKTRDHIYCTSPPRINVASRIDLICFDKTGTLTEEGLDVRALLPAMHHENTLPSFLSQTNQNSTLDVVSPLSLLHAMVSCHSIQLVNNVLVGDPLDIKMFEFTDWTLEESGETVNGMAATIVRHKINEESPRIGILKVFEFSSQLRRMSVIARCLDPKSSTLLTFTKGSPEIIKTICRKDTLPLDYNEILTEFTRQGFRVLACAGKYLENSSSKLPRNQVETDLIFLGFIIFENKLKPETLPVIKTLRDALIINIMSTGDNLLTAVCVGRSSGFIHKDVKYVFIPKLLDPNSLLPTSVSWECIEDPTITLDQTTWELDEKSSQRFAKIPKIALACTGDVMEHVFLSLGEGYTRALLKRCFIFARMSPSQKQILVEFYQKYGYLVGFCGDGANDCGALRAANVGISLSQTEASVAAPFTSKIANIRCVLALIIEGRASLTNSFCLFKYMALYSMIQFTTLVFLYSMASCLSNYQYAYIDLILVLPLSLLMPYFDSSKTLAKKPPVAKIFTFPILISIAGQFVLQLIFQSIAYKISRDANPNNSGRKEIVGNDPNLRCIENTCIFLSSIFMYLIVAMLFSQGAPHRRRWNWIFFSYSFFAFAFNAFIFWKAGVNPVGLLGEKKVIVDKLASFVSHLECVWVLNIDIRIKLILVSIAHGLLATIFEFFLFPPIVDIYNNMQGKIHIRTGNKPNSATSNV